MTFNDEDHRNAIANIDALEPGHREPDRPGLVGLDHVAYTCATLADRFANCEYLAAKGVARCWCIHHDDTVSMYGADQDGDQVEFQAEAFEAKRRAPPEPG